MWRGKSSTVELNSFSIPYQFYQETLDAQETPHQIIIKIYVI